MKVRAGFVSNSSSSSYIIAFMRDECPHCGRSNDDILTVFEGRNDYDDSDGTYIIAKDVQAVTDDLYEHHEENKQWYDAEGLKRDFAEITALVAMMADYSQKGYRIAHINVSHHEKSGIRDMIDDRVIIIKEFPG